MNKNKKKIIMTLLVGGLILGLASPNTVMAEGTEEVDELSTKEGEVILENEQDEATETAAEEDKINEVEDTNSIAEIQRSQVQSRVATLVADQTTLAEAFPDANFRVYVAETILKFEAGTYDDNTILTSANITRINSGTTINVAGKNISSLEGIQHFTSLRALNCENNNITGSLPVSQLTSLVRIICYNNKIEELDVTNLTNLTMLTCYNNQINELNVTNLINLTSLNCSSNNIAVLNVSNLTQLQTLVCGKNQISVLNVENLANLKTLTAEMNPISELNVNNGAKQTITQLMTSSTNIDSFDLTGFDALQILAVGKVEGTINLSNVKSLYIFGDRDNNQVVRLNGDAGAFAWDAVNEYYIISGSSNVKNGFNVATGDGTGVVTTSYLELSQDSLMDKDGNLLLGSTASDIQADGSVKLETGGTIISAEGVYTFNGSTTINDGKISTEDTFTFGKNTTTYDEELGTYVPTVDDTQTTVNVGNGTAIINSNGSNMELPVGSVITNNEGDKTYLTSDGSCDGDGNVTSNNSIITVPADKVDGIVVKDDGTINMPVGTIVSDGSGNITIPEGGVIFNPETGDFIEITTDSLEILNTPTQPIEIGDSFTLNVTIPTGEWTYDSEFFDVEVVDSSLSRATTTGTSIKFIAKKSGSTTIGYSINGLNKEVEIRILDKVIEPKPEEPKDPEDPSKPILPEMPTEKPTTKPTSKPSIDGGSTVGGASVNTSDTTNLELLCVLFGLSLIGIITVMRKKEME